MRVMYEAVGGDHGYHNVLDISSTETVLRRFEHGSLTPVGSMRTDMRALEDALAGADKDFFRGTVAYSHPHMRDGTRVRLTTPLGDITEYSVFTFADRVQWPQAILRLKPLFMLFDRWAVKLAKPNGG